MKCFQCNAQETKVIESREVSEGIAIRRRRECLSCQNRFTTYERLEQPQVIVIKSDGNRELFNRDKLTKGLLRATEKTPVTSLEIERAVTSIERLLQSRSEPEITSKEIGEMVMSELYQLNEVAYVRFASVYRKFKDITSFEKELAKLKARDN
jgi:transcriptional repressor NrdR